MDNGKTALLAVVTVGVLLMLGAVAMLGAASDRGPGPSSAQIDTFELMARAEFARPGDRKPVLKTDCARTAKCVERRSQ